MSVLCPKCHTVGAVKDSRRHEDLIVRRRQCKTCGERWTTWEEGESDTASLEREIRQLKVKNTKYRTVIGEIRRALATLLEKQNDQREDNPNP